MCKILLPILSVIALVALGCDNTAGNTAIANAIWASEDLDTGLRAKQFPDAQTKTLRIDFGTTKYEVSVRRYDDATKNVFHFSAFFPETETSEVKNISGTFDISGKVISGYYTHNDNFYAIMPPNAEAKSSVLLCGKDGANAEPVSKRNAQDIRAEYNDTFIDFMQKLKEHYRL